MKRLALMQPYIFPYLGYFQLIQAVDEFVFYDDAQFMSQSYINRNSILINEKPSRFTIPLKKSSYKDSIMERRVHENLYPRWKKKFLRSLEINYKKAPYFEPVYKLVSDVFHEDFTDISTLAIQSAKATCDYMGLQQNFLKSSTLNYDVSASAQDKVLEICTIRNATTYINSINGMDLYDEDSFRENGIKLLFLNPVLKPYDQSMAGFESHLSIIDAMMWMAPSELNEHVKNIKTIKK